MAHSPTGLTGPCWEPLHEWTDQELADNPDDDGSQTAAEVNAEERTKRDRSVEIIDAAANRLGIGPVRTRADLLDFLAAAGILGLSGGRYTLKPAPPLPAEALDLNNEERARGDKIRWHSLYERIGYDIIDLFDPDSQQTTTLKTTLERLGRETKANPESTRFGVLGLIEEGDFSANKDVARIEPHQVFELAVDWDKFNASRIGIGPTS